MNDQKPFDNPEVHAHHVGIRLTQLLRAKGEVLGQEDLGNANGIVALMFLGAAATAGREDERADKHCRGYTGESDRERMPY